MHLTLAAIATFAAGCVGLTMSVPQQNVNLRLDNVVALNPTSDTPSSFHLYLVNYNGEWPNPCIHLGQVSEASRSFTIGANSVPVPVHAHSGYTIRASTSASLTPETCSNGMLSETNQFDITDEYSPTAASARFVTRQRANVM
ncbi:hypothetical protein BJX64DRAFT_293252 [Aspergillus heterothallicus]